MTEKEIIALASKYGAEAGIQKYNEAREAARKEAADMRLHNIELLLKNYRNFKACIENAVYEADYSETALEIISDLMIPDRNPDLTIESVKRSAARTAILLEHIDRELNAFRYICERSKSPVRIRQWEVIYHLYISDDPYTLSELSEIMERDIHTLRKDRKAAFRALAPIMFGIDGMGL